jgi:hypothetical protein
MSFSAMAERRIRIGVGAEEEALRTVLQPETVAMMTALCWPAVKRRGADAVATCVTPLSDNVEGGPRAMIWLRPMRIADHCETSSARNIFGTAD